MTQRQIAALAVRILAIYAFFDAAKTLPSAFSLVGVYRAGSTLPTGSAGIMQMQTPGVLAQPVVVIGFAMFLWFFADGLATIMVKNDVEAAPVEKLSGAELQTVAFASIGIFAAFQALSRIAAQAGSLFYALRLGSLEVMNRQRAEIFGSVVMLILSICLVFGAQGFVRFIRAARDVGRDPEIMRDKTAANEPPNS